jgi:hypothetical protein
MLWQLPSLRGILRIENRGDDNVDCRTHIDTDAPRGAERQLLSLASSTRNILVAQRKEIIASLRVYRQYPIGLYEMMPLQTVLSAGNHMCVLIC